MKYILVALIVLVPYLAVSFVVWNLNASEWGQADRFAVVIFSIVAAAAAGLVMTFPECKE